MITKSGFLVEMAEGRVKEGVEFQEFMEIFNTLPGAQPFEALLDPSSMSMRHINQVRVYDNVVLSDGDA